MVKSAYQGGVVGDMMDVAPDGRAVLVCLGPEEFEGRKIQN